MKVYGYTRVSTKEQDPALQQEEIQKYAAYKNMEIARIYSDKASGKNTNRPQFQMMMESLRYNPLEVRAVVVHKLDRMGRSLKDLINIVQYLETHGIQFISITDNIDTTTPQGVLLFHLMGSFAEYERNLINERTGAGKKRALENGVRFGRKATVLPMETIQQMIADGRTKPWIANKYKISTATLYAHLRKYDAEKEAERIVSATY